MPKMTRSDSAKSRVEFIRAIFSPRRSLFRLSRLARHFSHRVITRQASRSDTVIDIDNLRFIPSSRLFLDKTLP